LSFSGLATDEPPYFCTTMGFTGFARLYLRALGRINARPGATILGMSRLLVLALAGVVLCACPTPRPPVGPTGPSEALAGLPPRTDPPLALDDDDDLERARHAYDALAVDDAGRAARRAELWKAYQAQIDAARARNDVATAYDVFAEAMGMWTPAELADEGKPAPGLDLVAPTADALHAMFSKAGVDTETTLALAVIRAARPERGADVQNGWDAIAAYADDLEVARRGPGAERARPIHILEGVTASFASPWACRLLAGLYLDRQAARQAALGKNDQHMEGAHGVGIQVPIWNLVRAYARMDKLAQVPDVLDGLAGQLGDDPDVRKLVREALSPGGRAEIIVAIAGEFTRGSFTDEEGRAGDLVTAQRICEAGVRLHPRALEPRRCLGLVAAQQNNAPLAIVHLEAAARLAPTERDLAALLASLYTYELADAMQGERPTAGKAVLDKLVALHADAAKRWPGKPLDPGLDAAYLAYGRGLYALGEIDGALEWLKKAHATKANPEALELVALIEHKRGKYVEAARDFEAASVLPRETPLEKKIDEARLLRLAADSRAAAGDAPGARTWWQAALGKWDQILGSGLTERQRVEALMERGRLLWALGERGEALHSFEAAVDSAGDSTQTSVFSDVIAFLVPRGEYAAALDAYHRGLGRKGGTEYFKIYTSLWIVNAARLLGAPPDPLAMEFLAGRSGTRWYHDLARFTAGELAWEDLYARANTRGKRAEAFFYQGLARYAAGDALGGQKLLRFVLDTDMLGFFEYDMAAYILAHGPPTAQR
jgi:tetratricopeptide (TPR) repeat protein